MIPLKKEDRTLRSDGVYVQFGMGHSTSQCSWVTPNCYYNMFRVMSDESGKDYIFTFGRMHDVFYDNNNPMQRKNVKVKVKSWDFKDSCDHSAPIATDYDSSDDENHSGCNCFETFFRFCKHGDNDCKCNKVSDPSDSNSYNHRFTLEIIEDKQDLYDKLEITNRKDPLCAAKAVSKLSVEFLKEYSCGEIFSFWDLYLHTPIEGDADEIDNFNHMGNCEHRSINNAFSLSCFDEEYNLIYGCDQWMNDDTPIFPYVFVPNDRTENGPWCQYYESWNMYCTIFCDKCGICLNDYNGFVVLGEESENVKRNEEASENEESSEIKVRVKNVCNRCNDMIQYKFWSNID
jgi:hypothetical protein